MKLVKLLIWVLAPLAMFSLAYLFLLPPEQAPMNTVQSLAVVLIDPISLDSLHRNSDLCPKFLEMSARSLTGTIVDNGARTMEQAQLEMMTGKSVRTLRQGLVTLDPDTYETIVLSPEQLHETDIKAILMDNQMTVGEMTISSAGADVVVERFPGGDGRSALFVRLVNDVATEQEYTQRLEDLIVRLDDEVDTWMIVSPMSEVEVTKTISINTWLKEQGYLAMTDQGTIDFSATRVFHAGGHEPGLRINQKGVYSQGTVPQADFEEFLQEVAMALRQIDPDKSLFRGLYPGSRAYPNRPPGQYPDIIWDLANASVVVSPELSLDIDSPGASKTVVAGGWILLSGEIFDEQLRDLSRIENLLAADVIPTVLYMLHLPVAKDMDGRVLRPAMKAEQHRRIPNTVDSYSLQDPLVEQQF